jgi:GAF domain-containing protein
MVDDPHRSESRPAKGANRATSRVATEPAAAAYEESPGWLMEAVARVASAVAHELDLSCITDVVLDQSVTTLGARVTSIHTADDQLAALRLLGQRNLPDDPAARVAVLPLDAPSLAAYAARSQEPQMVRSLADLDPKLVFGREMMLRTVCQSAVSLPLMARGRLVGVHTFGLSQPHEFTAEERAAYLTCAEIFAFAIRTAKIYEEERRLRSLFKAIVDHAP